MFELIASNAVTAIVTLMLGVVFATRIKDLLRGVPRGLRMGIDEVEKNVIVQYRSMKKAAVVAAVPRFVPNPQPPGVPQT